MCMLLLLGQVYASVPDKTIELTLTVGVPYTISPYVDLGIPYNWVEKSYNPNDADENDGGYSLVDGSGTGGDGFSIITNSGTSKYINGSPYRYNYSYTLTPLKTGFFTFKQRIYYTENSWSTNWGRPVITYNITVVSVTGISIPESLSLSLGEEYKFSPVIIHIGASTTLTWLSSNNTVATVSSDGIVTTKGLGTTTISCTTHNGVYAQCIVTVNPVLVSEITLSETEAEMVVGEKRNLTATVQPTNATNKSLTWSSTNEAVAVVDESGQVTAVGSGTCQIKATANDGSGKTASCLVTVEKNNKLTVTDMTQCSGGRGVLNVLLTDEETIMGFQFDLQLPAGVTVAEKDGKLLAQLTGNAVNTHSISSSKVSDGLYRFVVTPQGSRAISQANGDGMTITIDVADNVAIGTYTMTIKDIEMTVKKAGNVYEDIHPKNSTATLTVTEAVMGDVNGDGRVSVTDVISMNSYILEEEPAQFIRKVADLNGDGKVTITDLVQVIDIILGR